MSKFIVWADGQEDSARVVNAADMSGAIETAAGIFGAEPAVINVINAESVSGGLNIAEAEYWGVAHVFEIGALELFDALHEFDE